MLSVKFPATKFLKSVSTTCIPNFPDSNLPSIFIYFEGDLKKQLIGPHEFRGMNLTVDELEWILGQFGAVPTKLEEDPRPKVRDVLFSKLKSKEDDSDNDW
ncbi:Viral IAP-associated factor [Blattella germanica]|nr:Viral IAP-associated factor [Blattella germanica]